MNNEKKYFALKLIPPRPSFPKDMTPEEQEIMQQHSLYWTNLMGTGIVVVYGPVMDPNGTYGFGIVEVDHEEQAMNITIEDPAARILKYECYPMLTIVPRK